MRSVTIESCTEGYLVWILDENGLKKKEQYAVSQDKLVQKVKELLGITDKSKAVIWAGDKGDKKERIDVLRDASKELIEINPEPFSSEYSKFPKYTTISPTILKSVKLSFTFTDLGAFEVSVQPITKGKTIYWLHPGGKKIKISRDGYRSVFIYANISDLVYLYEHPAEAPAIITAYSKAAYENKAVILRGFLKDIPLSALVGDNHHDEVIIAKKEEPKGQEDGSCDDVAFESCANNTPEQCRYCIDQSRYENKNKLAAKKPASPLMKASVPP